MAMGRWVFPGAAALLASAAWAAEPPGFASPPAAARAGDKVAISFAVKAPCDAAVWVEDGQGKVVRHLAAGLLGDNSPEPFQKGLAQKLEWDGKGDAGKPAPAGCKVRVGLGLGARFDRLLGFDPGTVGQVAGTATDEQGNVYVLTHDDFDIRSTPQVMVFGPDGKYQRTLLPWAADVPWEQVKDYWVEIGPGRRVPRVHQLFQALYPLGPKQGGQGWDKVVAISGEPLKLAPGGKAAPSGGKGLFRPMHLVASRTREEIFVRQWAGAKWTRFDGRTGEATELPLKEVGDLAAAPDGTLVGHQENSRLVRFDRDGRQLAVLDEGVLGTVRGGNFRGVRGLDVAPGGDIYLLHYSGRQGGSGKGLGPEDKNWSTVLLDVYSPDGRKKSAGLLTLSAYSGGVRADRAGDVLVSEDVRPPDRPVPPEFARLPAKEQKVYRYIYGSILRFGPAGGKVTVYGRGEKPPAEGTAGISQHWSGELQARITGDLKRLYPDIAPTGAGWGDCTCYVPRFDLDGFGRLYAPEVPLFSVKVLDGAGNQLLRVGAYGNADDPLRIADSGLRIDGNGNGQTPRGSPQSEIRNPQSAIHFAWPAYVAVTDEALYVSDMLNRRVLRAKLIYAAEGSCAIP